MAVFAAITTLYVGKYSAKAILFQGQETNQWGYYQAKSIKGYLYETQLERLELERLGDGQKTRGEASEKREKTIAHYKETIKRYDKEKAEIKGKADDFAKQKVVAQDKAGNFGYALIFLQAAIHAILCSRYHEEETSLVLRNGHGFRLGVLLSRCYFPFPLTN